MTVSHERTFAPRQGVFGQSRNGMMLIITAYQSIRFVRCPVAGQTADHRLVDLSVWAMASGLATVLVWEAVAGSADQTQKISISLMQ